MDIICLGMALLAQKPRSEFLPTTKHKKSIIKDTPMWKCDKCYETWDNCRTKCLACNVPNPVLVAHGKCICPSEGIAMHGCPVHGSVHGLCICPLPYHRQDCPVHGAMALDPSVGSSTLKQQIAALTKDEQDGLYRWMFEALNCRIYER